MSEFYPEARECREGIDDDHRTSELNGAENSSTVSLEGNPKHLLRK